MAFKSKLQACTALALAAVTTLSLAACSGQNISSKGTDDAGGNENMQSSSSSVSAEDAEYESEAIVLHIEGDVALFVDRENGGVYIPSLPDGAIKGIDGQTISAKELAVGSIVRVRGNGIMLESYPGQYPGVTAVEVIDEGNPANAEPYAEVIAQVFPEADPYEVATGTLEYTTADSTVAVMLTPFGSVWDTADGTRVANDGDVFAEDGTLLEDVPDARIPDTLKATVQFSVHPTRVEITCKQIVVGENGSRRLDPASGSVESVDSEEYGAGVSFAMSPGYLYNIAAQFEHGDASFVFATTK